MSLEKIRVEEIFTYNPRNGNVYWITHPTGRSVKRGTLAGSKTSNGYIRIKLGKKEYLAHRLAWRLFYNSWPNSHLDHINGNGRDNRIFNLREVSVRENANNRWTHRKGRLPGTSPATGSSKWRAYIVINGKQRHLGCFKTERLAHLAYKKELQCLKKEKK